MRDNLTTNIENKTHVKCPNCGAPVDVQNQLENEIKQQFQTQYNEQYKKLLEDTEKFEQAKKQQAELIQEKLEKQLKEEKSNIEKTLTTKLKREQADYFEGLQKELNEKSTQIKELNQTKAEMEKLKRENSEITEKAKLDAQKQINETLLMEKDKIKKSEEEKHELRIKELHKQLDDQKKLTEEMKRKQEQGSSQMHGEVQELAIEAWLISKFPLDTIEEIKKGARGADCIQTVNTRNYQNCGKIYYESKRTQIFQPSWIEKFKTDMRDKGADVGVLVTEATPPDFERMGIQDGIWICSYEEFKGLCAVLRESIIQLNIAVRSQENKGDKMHMLYDYLTSNEFKMQIEAIAEGFSEMQSDLEKEKRAMQKIWKQREKQIDKIIKNTIDMHGSITGIAGNAIPPVNALELSSIPAIDKNGEAQSKIEVE